MNGRLLSACALCVISVSATPPDTVTIPLPAGGSLNFTVYLNNVQDAQTSSSNAFKTLQTVERHESSALKTLSKLSPNGTVIHCEPEPIGWYAWLKGLSAQLLGVMILPYAGFCYLIVRANAYVQDQNRWALWRQDLTLEQLLSIPQEQLARELVQEIQRRYSKPGSLTDTVNPFVTFAAAIDQEQEYLQWYYTGYSHGASLKLTAIIPFSSSRLARIPEYLQRLSYYKNIFYSWAYSIQPASTPQKIITREHRELSHVARTLACVSNGLYK